MKTTRARRVRRAALFAVWAVSVAAATLGANAGGAVASPLQAVPTRSCALMTASSAAPTSRA